MGALNTPILNLKVFKIIQIIKKMFALGSEHCDAITHGVTRSDIAIGICDRGCVWAANDSDGVKNSAKYLNLLTSDSFAAAPTAKPKSLGLSLSVQTVITDLAIGIPSTAKSVVGL
jgi:hypothetical protein